MAARFSFAGADLAFCPPVCRPDIIGAQRANPLSSSYKRHRDCGRAMTIGTIDQSQRKAATVVGLSYLFALPPAIFAEFYVRTQLIAFDNVAQTARNIMAHERLFRLGIASNLTVFAVDVVLIMALYVVLMPVNRSLALLATGWGLIETAILVVVTLSDFDVLRILSGVDYLHVFEANQLQALARLSVAAHDAAYRVGLVLAGLRSTAFGYLWLKSRFIPRALAAWGMFASFLMGACAFSFIIFPEFAKVVGVEIYGAPIFFFELIMGFWLLLRGLPPSGAAAPDRVSGSAQAGSV
jgi:Domain of unknown function (DUF4386)